MILFVVLGVALNTNKIDPYEKVDGVSAPNVIVLYDDLMLSGCRSGVGSVLNSKGSSSRGRTCGYGSQWWSRWHRTPYYFCGHAVISMSTSLAGGASNST